MQLGLVGLGKMGFNMRERLREGGHEVIGYDPRPEVTDVPTLRALAEALDAPRVVWVMVPSGRVTDETITSLAEVLSPGDLVIDGGNSRYTEDGPHAKLLDDKGIAFIDAETACRWRWRRHRPRSLPQSFAWRQRQPRRART